MKFSLALLFPFYLLLSSCGNTTSESKIPTMEVKEPTSLLRHVVLFNFNESTTPDKLEEIEQAFAGLPHQIPAIHSFEWGTNNSPEGLDKGLTHCFFVTFLSEEDRATYLPHPAHQAFVKLIGPYVEDVTVVDYWTK